MCVDSMYVGRLVPQMQAHQPIFLTLNQNQNLNEMQHPANGNDIQLATC